MPWLMALRVGLVAGHAQQHEEQVELEVAEHVAVDVGGEEVADTMSSPGSARLRSAISWAKTYISMAAASGSSTVDWARYSGSSKPMRPLEQVEDRGWRSSRGTPRNSAMAMRRRSAATSVTKSNVALLLGPGDDRLGLLLEVLVELADAAGREALVDDLAELGVVGRIEVQHHQPDLLERRRPAACRCWSPPGCC